MPSKNDNIIIDFTGMKLKIIILFFLLLALLTPFLTACNTGCLDVKEKEVKKLLNSNLSIGDSREQVEIALKNIDIEFSYDKYSNRYQATIWDERCGPYQALSVYIVLNESEKVSDIKVFKSYTMP